MAAPKRKKSAASAKSSPKRAVSPRRKSSGGPSLWMIFGGLIAVGIIGYFLFSHRDTSVAGADPLQQKVSKMAEENPEAEIFQLKEEPVQKVSEKKK